MRASIIICIVLVSLIMNHITGNGQQQPIADHLELSLSMPDADSKLMEIIRPAFQKKYSGNKDSLRQFLWRIAAAELESGHYENCTRIYQYANKVAPIELVQDSVQRHLLYAQFYGGGHGSPYYYIGENVLAAKYLNLALEHAIVTPDTPIRVQLYNEIGNTMYAQGDTERVIHFFDKALALSYAQSKRDYTRIIAILNNKAALFKADKAIALYREAYEIAREGNIRSKGIAPLMNIGNVYLEMGAYTKALSVLEKAHKEMQSLDVLPLEKDIRIYHYLGRTYMMLKQYAAAERYLLQAYNNAVRDNLGIEQYQILRDLPELYKMKGDYKNALKYHELYAHQYIKQVNEQSKQAIRLLDINFHTAEKDKEIAEKQTEIARRDQQLQAKNVLIWGIGSGTILISGMFLLVYRNFRNKQHLFSKEQKIIRLNALMNGEEKERSRIAQELHDGIGGILSAAKMSLSSVVQYNTSEEYNAGMQLLDEVYQELRYVAHNLSPEILKTHELPDAINIFCEQTSQSHKLTIDFQAFGTVPPLPDDVILFLYRIVQELIQNIVKHASATEALVQLSIEDEYLKITVEDNGIGIDTEKADRTGIGMSNLLSRVTTLNGIMDIDSRPGEGTTVYLEFDIAYLQKDKG